MTSGRPRSQKPATAYDYRRAILLVQVLAMPPNHDMALVQLCKDWGVEPTFDTTLESYGVVLLRQHETICALARHAIKHGRQEGNGNEHR